MSEPRASGESHSERSSEQRAERELVFGLLAAPGLAHEVAQQLARELPDHLRERFPGVDWRVDVAVERLAGAAGLGLDLVDVARRRMLAEVWAAVVFMTDLPLHAGRRPVTVQASITLGVGLVSVPALGGVATATRAREAVLHLADGLLGERLRLARRRHVRSMGAFVRARLRRVAYPVGTPQLPEAGTVRFLTSGVRGNLRLIIGMVRTNRPWRLFARLSRALVAGLAIAVFSITSPGVWRIAAGMGLPRPIILSVGSIAGTCALVMVVHGLWERSSSPNKAVRDQVSFFNVTTALTLLVGVAGHYAVLFVLNTAFALLLVAPSVLGSEIHHAVAFRDYVWIAWLVSSLATIGGALGAAVENEEAVREAAYGYRAEEAPADGHGS